MQAGRLRQRIMLQEPVETVDVYGERIITWSDVAEVWAAVEPLRGREMFDAEQVQAEISHRVRIRYRSGVTERMRVLYRARLLQIQMVIHVQERQREMQLMCREMPDA